MTTARDPSGLTDAEIKAEVVELLARAIVRLLAERRAEIAANPLAVPGEREPSSPVCATRNSETAA